MFLVSWLCAGATREARADSGLYSEYEKAAIRRELASRGWELEPEPEGKLITDIEIVTLDVFDETDPVPDFVNIFHTISRPGVIRRELLFRPGERYSRHRLDESARNLKSLPQLSVVLVVPARDPVDGRVRVLVITKDVWSLRLNSNIEYGPEGLTYLLLNPTEWNVAGTHASLGGLFILKRSTYSAGFTVSQRRIWGSRLYGSFGASLVFNRSTGAAEGSNGTFSYGVPRYSERQRWYYGTAITWDDGLTRVAYPPEHATVVMTYHRELYYGVASATRSFGTRYKLDLTAGAEADRRFYRAQTNPEAEAALNDRFEREELPVSDTRISPFVQVTSFENRFLKTIELELLGLQEDFQLGAQARLKVYPATTKVGSSRDLIGISSSLAYTQRLGNGLARGIATSNIQYANQGKHQGYLALQLRIASPRLGFGRLIVDGILENRYENYLNSRSALGGDGRLRGYPYADTEVKDSGNQRGADLVAFNTEFRSAGIDILSAQCGLAAFHDVGGAANSFDSLALKQSVGFGARVLFPQADRIAFRLDWAFPLNPGPGYTTLPGYFIFSVGQAFPMPEL